MSRRVNITPKAYSYLLRARAPKPTDKRKANGDYSVELTPESEKVLTVISMYRKLNRKTASQSIATLAHGQKIITDAEYRSTWGKGY